MTYTLYKQIRTDGPFRVLRDYADLADAKRDASECASAENAVCVVEDDHGETWFRAKPARQELLVPMKTGGPAANCPPQFDQVFAIIDD